MDWLLMSTLFGEQRIVCRCEVCYYYYDCYYYYCKNLLIESSESHHSGGCAKGEPKKTILYVITIILKGKVYIILRDSLIG